MWTIPLLILCASAFWFSNINKITNLLHIRLSSIATKTIKNLSILFLLCLVLTASIMNIYIWGTESAVILTLTLFGPLMFITIYKKSN